MIDSIKKANKEFYDTISDDYERIDGKRTKSTTLWLRKRLFEIVNKKTVLLDVGCGSGFILRNCGPKLSVGIDISPNILKPLKKQDFNVVCADVDYLPFKINSFDLISCFAVLHHLLTAEGLIKESSRVLKKNGIFYSDHDLDLKFVKNFKLLFKIYRTIFNEEKKHLKNVKITKELYRNTEVHTNGLDSDKILHYLENYGFKEINPKNHFMGLFSILTQFLLKVNIKLSRGFAPLFSVTAKK